MSAPDGGGTVELEAAAESVSSLGPGTQTPKLPFAPHPLKPGLDLDVVNKATRELVEAGRLGASARGGGNCRGTLLGGVFGAGRISADFAPAGARRREVRVAPATGGGGGGGTLFAGVLGAGRPLWEGSSTCTLGALLGPGRDPGVAGPPDGRLRICAATFGRVFFLTALQSSSP